LAQITGNQGENLSIQGRCGIGNGKITPLSWLSRFRPICMERMRSLCGHFLIVQISDNIFLTAA
jgi:hypothetical protein